MEKIQRRRLSFRLLFTRLSVTLSTSTSALLPRQKRTEICEGLRQQLSAFFSLLFFLRPILGKKKFRLWSLHLSIWKQKQKKRKSYKTKYTLLEFSRHCRARRFWSFIKLRKKTFLTFLTKVFLFVCFTLKLKHFLLFFIFCLLPLCVFNVRIWSLVSPA